MILPSIQEKLIQYRIGLPEALLGKPATEQQLSTFEANYGAIPDDYRWFLLCYGGGVVGSERLDDIVELADSHAKFSREFGPPHGWTMENVFIIGWDGCGNPIGIEASTGCVLVEDHNFGGVLELAPSFESFLLNRMES